jgi:hypothetical protein
MYRFYHCKLCSNNFITKAKRLKFCERCGRKDAVIVKRDEDVYICDYCKALLFGPTQVMNHKCAGIMRYDKKELMYWYEDFESDPVNTMRKLKEEIPDDGHREMFIERMNEVADDYKRSIESN